MGAGVVVAGGRSTRFGDRDKAVADLAGTPMIRRVVDRLTLVVDELVVNCRRDQGDAIEAALDGCGITPKFAFDETPDEGPMAGIGRGLRATESEYGVVVACDMPFVDPSFVSYLFDRAEGHDAAVPRPDEWFQTTQAVYRTDAMESACDRALERGEHKIVEALFDLDYVVVDREEIANHTTMETFENLNTREEFEAAAERF
ncbi:molybdenum cofactor guanylyltransferase [Halomicroarcula sp. F13]|uniref:Probable molybdenum cofactor guanylyltransferase n=1 Tax=Haloarcula rubra TaxID=2487747 RepID=A0AAW4PYA8_9EURY|nr:molybdenum cofactor guanylyltransferase [Halomicroarcula rubra]MBX0325079.1 molybdenum cofactor guanylyltransferase [Halomicroarcula rubra]